MRPKKLDKLMLKLETQPSENLNRRIAALIKQAAKQRSGRVSPELTLWRYLMQSKITKIAAATKRPEKVIGMNFMNPVPIMSLVEVIKGYDTSDRVTEQVMEVARKLG